MEENKNYIKVKRHKWPDEIEKEKTQTKRRFFVVFVCLLCFGSGFIISNFAQTTGSKNIASSKITDSKKFNEVYNTMKNDWYYGKDIENLDDFLLNNAIVGLITNEYDEHTNYLESDSANRLLQKLEGTIVGIGMEYTMINENPVITKVFLNSPAKNMGLKEGDIIKKVNGISVEGKDLDEITELTKGEEGTTVTIVVVREGKEVSFDIVRANISTTVYGYTKASTGVIELNSFSERTNEEVEAYLKDFKKNDISNIIIDMRDNTGGYVETTINIASLFMGKDKVVIKEENKAGEISEYVTKASKNVYEYDRVVVLVNGKTASAAEALTACLKEQINATVVGVNTYGKGTVQNPKVFSDGSYLKYTTAQWLTPSGEKIHHKGIAPDIEVKLDEAFTYSFTEDEGAYQVDSVGGNVKNIQICLKTLGYNIDRTDGYYSNTTLEAVKAFQKALTLEENGVINLDLVMMALSKTRLEWATNQAKYDVQLNKAIEVANGK